MMLKNKICIVTGASQGIGRAISEEFLKEGAIVYGMDIKKDSMQGLETCHGDFFHSMYLDVTDRDAVKRAFTEIKNESGRIDVLVNNAGVVFNRKIGMITREETELMFRVNVLAVIEMTQFASRLMARTGGGAVINIASVTAVQGAPGQSAYSASKGAVIAFSKSAAKELASQNIRVNVVAPGIVRTERFAELYEADGEKIDDRIARIGLGRLAEPQDVAKACVFLASDNAAYISGQVLGVDGCARI